MNEAMLYWGLALLAAALLLIIIEIFVPSGGIIGVVAAGVAIAGVVCLFRYSLPWGFAGLLLVLVGGPSAIAFGLHILPSTPFGRAMLGGPDPEIKAEREMIERQQRQEFISLVGSEGVALTDLRPVGTVRVEGERHEATAEASYIRAGEGVRVTGVDMTTLKVRPANSA